MATSSSSFQRSNTQSSLTHSATTASTRPTASSTPTPAPKANTTISPSEQPRRQHFVLSDPVALIYLEQDPNTTVVERRHRLKGYQKYIVEQWTCSRTHPTFLITVYTGDPAHEITVGVLGVPADEDKWSDRLRVYFQVVSEFHARRKETPLGILLTTNLSSFPSSLTLILVPDGDIKKHREDFFVNENLKRLGCSGRAGMTLAEPSNATKAKFYQLYKVNDKPQFYNAVIELVKLCQAALVIFGLLEPEYADGLLCDFTERALGDWWTEIGTDLYNIEPSDGNLGPTTVSALLGALMGARNRLQAYGAPVSKDAFDIESTKRAVAYFQKAQKLTRTRRLDRHTFQRLHRATAKQASGEGWAATRAVKSTMAELSGKGGEMVMEMVGNRDKARIAEVETVDVENFAHLVRGERAQWLWQGKLRKRTTRDMFGDVQLAQNPAHRVDDESTPTSALPRISFEQDAGRARNSSNATEPASAIEPGDVDPLAKRTVLNRAKGRLKGTVGMKTNVPQKGKDSSPLYGDNAPESKSVESLDSVANSASPTSTSFIPTTDGTKPRVQVRPAQAEESTETATVDDQPQLAPPIDLDSEDISPLGSVAGDRNDTGTGNPTDAEDENEDEDDPHTNNADTKSSTKDISVLLQRTHSLSHLQTMHAPRNDAWWPRNLSFSTAESAILLPAVVDISPNEADDHAESYFPEAKQDLAHEHLLAATARQLRHDIACLSATLGESTTSKLRSIEELDTLAAQDADQLNAVYAPRAGEFANQQERSAEVVAEERTRLQDMVREVETLGQKLEYEIGGLRSRVEEVEGAVQEFELSVEYTEDSVRELVGKGKRRVQVAQGKRQGWVDWLWKMITGKEEKTNVKDVVHTSRDGGLGNDDEDGMHDMPLKLETLDGANADINEDLSLNGAANGKATE